MTEITTYLPALNRYGDADIAINNEIGYLVKYEDHAAIVAALNEQLSRYTMSAGQCDQRRSESDAVRVALGFDADDNDVSPGDLLEKIAALNEKVQALAAEGSQMLRLLTAISSNHVEYYSDGECGMFAGVPLDYVSEINMYVGRDVNAENPLQATDSIVNGVRAQGIHFAANRILAAWETGFIDDTARQAYDISGAVLSAIEFLPNASDGEFSRDYADEVRARIRKGEQE